MIAEFLKIGKANAISTPDLCELAGFSCARELRAAVAKERREGAVILSSCAGGYFLPQNMEEAADFVRSQDRKAKSIMASLKSAKKYMKTFEGQLCMNEGM